MVASLSFVGISEKGVFPVLGPVVGYVLLADFDQGQQIEPPPASAWPMAVPELREHRLASVALRLIRDRSLAVDAAVIEQLRRVEFVQSIATGLVMSRAPEALKLLEEARIRTVVLKGPGLAMGDRGLQERPFSDLDILVSPADFSESLLILRRAGYSEALLTRQPRDWCNRLCREAINLKRADGGSVDLHHHVPPWFWGRALAFDQVWIQSTPLTVGNVTCQVPSVAHRALLACLHVISDRSRAGETLRVWRDILMSVESVDGADLVSELARLDMTSWVQWVLGQLPHAVQPRALLDELGRTPTRARGQVRLRYLLNNGDDRSETVVHLARVPWPNGILYLWALAFPSSEFLFDRYGDRRRRFQWLTGKRPSIPGEESCGF
jgi:hypothetical protein